VDLKDPAKVDRAALERSGILAAVIPGDATQPVHLIAGNATAQLAAALQPAV
jgi:PTS system N-acetylglucosamine-specific IIC component